MSKMFEEIAKCALEKRITDVQSEKDAKNLEAEEKNQKRNVELNALRNSFEDLCADAKEGFLKGRVALEYNFDKRPNAVRLVIELLDPKALERKSRRALVTREIAILGNSFHYNGSHDHGIFKISPIDSDQTNNFSEYLKAMMEVYANEAIK